jgi:formate dehydrogenase subunit beta
MPVNSAKAVSDYSRLKPSESKVAVVLRPCELRALIELVKLNQANLENLILIGFDCAGTFSVQDYAESFTQNKSGIDSETLLKMYLKLENKSNIRSACGACEYFMPESAEDNDVTLGLYGGDLKKQFIIKINSEKADKILEPLGLKFSGTDINSAIKNRDSAIAKLRETRLKITEKLEADTHDRLNGLDNFMTEFSACINCHNCMEVCPICYCRECFFDSPTFDLESDKYFKMANRKGAMRMPANMFLFHVTRFNHMVLSCIACGMCEQGCPVDIKLLSIYKMVGKRAQKVFDYVPGKSLSDEIPILTFEEEELEPK